MTLGDTQDLQMSGAEYRLFCEFARDQWGLHFDDQSRFTIFRF